MRVPGARLNGAERRAIAEAITGKQVGGDTLGASTGRCATADPMSDIATTPGWNGWGPDLTNARFQQLKAAGLTPGDIPRLKLQWAFGYPDANIAWSQPTIAGGRLFVGSQNGTVYSLNAKSGCIYWVFSAGGGVRTAPSVGRMSGKKGYVVYFGDTTATAYALDAMTGAKLWTRKVESHPLARITGAPALYDGRLYVPMSSYEEAQGANPDYGCCTFRGSITALDASTGDIVWKTYAIPEAPSLRGHSTKGTELFGPAGGSIWSAPTIDARRGRLYAATGNTYSGKVQPNAEAVLAFDLKTGKILWVTKGEPMESNDVYIGSCNGHEKENPNCPEKNGPDVDFGTSPVLTKTPGGKDLIVIGSKNGLGMAMDPDQNGKMLWQYRAGQGSILGGIEWGVAADGEKIYFPLSDILRPKPGGLHALSPATGERLWYAPPQPPKCPPGPGCNAAQSAAITVIPGAIFSGANDGVMRAYSTKDGAIIWEYDTNREFQTLNGVPAHGASMIGPGPVIAGGMLYFNSGYGAFGGRPGNVLLAFRPE